MKKILSESGHLLRLVVVLAVGVAVFLMIRHAVVPAGFGEYGHYRAPSIDDVRAHRIAFAGHETCEACHGDIAAKKGEGRHAKVACEACHGALAAHADDPMASKAIKPNPATLCVRCHEADSAKPKGFPQVVSKEHAGDTLCTACHDAHKPKI